MEENINESIKNYLNTLKESYKRKESPEWAKQPIEKGSGRYYDNNEITDNHPLNKHIADGAYKTYASVVFDTKTYNFHIFPNNRNICKQLSIDFSKKSKEIINSINKITDKYSTFGGANTGKFKLLYDIEEKYSVSEKFKFNQKNHEADIYKYIGITSKGFTYYITFMRYTYNDKTVGCTMREIQFHKQKHLKNPDNNYLKQPIHINKDINGSFSICYTATADDNDYKTNGANSCYNPPVNFEDSPELIAKRFLEFIDNIKDIENNQYTWKTQEELNKIYPSIALTNE